MSRYIPTIIKAGVTFDLLLIVQKYQAPDWSATLYLRGPENKGIESSSDSAPKHHLYASAAETKNWKAGVYTYAVRVSRGDDVEEIEAGTLQVLADIASLPEGHEARSQNRRILDAITAVIEKRATQDQEKYRINNRELWRTPLADLLALRNQYAALVAAEEARDGGRSQWGPAVKVRL